MPHIPYRPFIDPIELHSLWWLLLIPMALGVSVVYKAIKVRADDSGRLQGYWQAVAVMTIQIIVGMIALAIASYLGVVLYAQWIAERVH